jgi:VWFA-related protein
MALPLRLLCLALTAASLNVPLSAQPTSDKAPPPPIISESIDVRVVNVEAVVTDSSSRRVRGLGAADLRLLVDGREVPVEYFAEMEEGRAASRSDAAASPQESSQGRSYLVFLDDSFAIAAHRNAALSGIEAELGQLGPEDRMAILAFDGRNLDVLSPWTADHGVLTAALAAARRRATGGGQHIARRYEMEVDDVEIAMAAGLSPFMMEFLALRRNEEAWSQSGHTTAALVAALEGLETPPGRKVMFLVSAGWQVGKAPRFYSAVVRAANRLGYTLYPVDTADLDPVPQGGLEWLAGATGGKVVKAGLRHSAFAEARDDAGSYYGLGFTPSWKGNDSGHSIRVEARRPGLEVRSRQSFTDLSRQTQTALRAESLLLFAGAGRPEDRLLRVELGQTRPAGRQEVEVAVTLGVPLAALQVTPSGKGYAAEAPLAVAAVDDKGRRASLPGSRLRVLFKEAPKAGGYARFKTVIKLRKAPQHIVFTVDDPVAGAVLWGEAEVKL